MKAAWSAMRIGSTDTDASEAALEAELRRAQEDLVARPEPGAVDALPVHLDAVRGPEVDDPVRPVLPADLRVPAGDVGVVERHVALARAPEDDRALAQVVPLAPRQQDGRLVREAERLGVLCGDGLRRGGRGRVALCPS